MDQIKGIFFFLVLAVIVIGLVLLSILPAMSEITVEERDGVLYVSNVYPIDVLSKEENSSELWGARIEVAQEDSQDLTLGKSKYDEYMEKGQNNSQNNKPGIAELFFWKAGEYALWRSARILEAQDYESRAIFYNAGAAYNSIGDTENARRNYILDAQRDEASGDFTLAARTYRQIGMVDELRRLMDLQKQKMQDTLAK